MIERLQELIRIPSYSGQERELQEYIQTQLRKVDIDPFFQGENLLVHLKGVDPTRAFIFNGHVDVVDVGDISRWTHSPWGGDIDNGKIFGRGSADMKAGILAEMLVAETLSKRKSLPTDVWFTFVAKEEVDGSGTASFATWFQQQGFTDQYTQISALIAEPTSLQTAEHGHRGNFFLRAVIEGTSAHSAKPHAIKKHTILDMIRFIQDLQAEATLWGKQFKSGEFTSPTITPTSISALSGSPNKTPDKCETVFDLRTIPGFHEEALERVQELAQKRGVTIALLYPPGPTGYTRPDAKIVQAIQKVVPAVKLAVNEVSNDLGFLTKIGIEGIIFGPGDESVVHTVDEYAEVDQVLAAPAIFEKVYLTWAKE